MDFETVKSVFAIIGVVATTGGLGWRVYTWRRERATRVVVKVSNALPMYGPHNKPGEWSFEIEALNKSDHPVRVTSVGFELPDGRTLVQVERPFPSALPCDIRPHDSAMTLFEVEQLEAQGMDTFGEIIGFVNTSDGSRFASEAKGLRSRD